MIRPAGRHETCPAAGPQIPEIRSIRRRTLTLINCSLAELVHVAARAGYNAVCPRFIWMIAALFRGPPCQRLHARGDKVNS